MKRFILFVPLATLIAVISFVTSCKEEECKTIVSGIVIDSITQLPVPDLIVSVQRNVNGFNLDLRGTAFTNSDGSFYIISSTTLMKEDITLHVTGWILNTRYEKEKPIPIKSCSIHENIVIMLNPG